MQLADELVGTGQVRQLVPQLCVLSAKQLPAQSLKPALHASEQAPEEHTGEALGRAVVHAVQLGPQLMGPSSTQIGPQR